jgi:hypothetical protein
VGKEDVICGKYSTNDEVGYGYKILIVKPEGKKKLVDLGPVGRTILKRILRKSVGKKSTGCV